jgi:succinoglycan biosynthesis transport protein ExoP
VTALDALRAARRWWWLLILCPLLAAVAAYLVSDAQTPIYRAQAVLVIEEQPSADNSSYNDILASERRASTYSRLVQARPVLEQTISQLGLSLTPEQLAGKLAVAPITDTQLITIAVSDPSPSRAADIANTVGAVFVQQIVAQQASVTGASREELDRNLLDVKRHIDETSASIDSLSAGPDAASASVQANILALQTQLSQLQTTYSALLEAQQRMDIAKSQTQAQLRVAEPAIAPSAPISPRIKLNTAVGGLLGLFIAGGLVLLLSYLDNTVKDSESLRRFIGVPALGEIPSVRRNLGLETLVAPQSQVSEAFRGLRTNLQFAVFGREIRSIVVTSARPGDGKTTTIANLAIVLAQGGQQVIVVDADLRKPRLHQMLRGVHNRQGLTNLLLSDGVGEPESVLQQTPVSGLRVLTTGPLPPNPPDLLASQRMRDLVARLESMADIVMFDAPPRTVSDPLILAGLADSLLLVTTSHKTRANELQTCIDDIQRTGTPLIGIVVNRAAQRGGAYYYYPSEAPASLDPQLAATAPRRSWLGLPRRQRTLDPPNVEL